MARMLRKSASKAKVCNCNKHHNPTSWARAARRRGRAAEKQKWKREEG